VFQPGRKVGTTDLVIRVQRERQFAASARVDNHGLRETGRWRFRGEAQVNNLTGVGDWLGGTVQVTAEPANSVYWFSVYERPIADRWRLELSANENTYDVGGEFADQDISSRTWGLGMALTREFVRSRQQNLTASLALDRKHAQTEVVDEPVTQDELTVLALRLNYDAVDTRYAGLNAVYFEYAHGFDDLLGSMDDAPGLVAPSRVNSDGEFAAGKFDMLLLAASRLQSLSLLSEHLRHHSLLLRTELQWSDDLLVPMQQYAVGGPANLRAYQPTEALFDKAVFASVEWIVNAPFIADKEAFANRTWGEVLQISAFYDWAYGRVNEPLLPENESETYGGAGLGLTFTYPDRLMLRLIAARRVTSPKSENGRQPQYWADLTFDF
jgi:hemolysin activation/secretion protein